MIDKIIKDIDVSLENGAFLGALALALTLPDICGKAEFPTENSTKKRYRQWYDNHVNALLKPYSKISEDMPYLSADIVYSLRCSFLHQGTPNIETSDVSEDRCKVDKFILVIEDENEVDQSLSKVSYGKNMEIVNRELTIDIRTLCYYLRTAAKNYYDLNKSFFNFFNYTLIDEREERKIIRELKEKREIT